MIRVVTLQSGSVAALRALGQNLVDHVLADIADAARAKWIQLASERLSSSRFEYINGILPVEMEGHAATITLLGQLPNMVENGADAFDMHPGLLGDDASFWTESADGGRFRVIPFRHKGPTAGPTGGTPIGFAFTQPGELSRRVVPPGGIDTSKLAADVYKKAKALKPGKSLPAGLVPKLKPTHATDIYAGMIKNRQAVAGGKAQSTYTTFRTIAVDPSGQPRPPGKWLHPGIEPRNLLDDVTEYVARVAPLAIEQAFLSALGGK